MVIAELLKEAVETLTAARVDNPRLDAEVLLAHLLQKERLFLLLHRDESVTEPLCEAYRLLVQRRAEREPVAYLTGSREFMSLPFQVRPGVLIPRPDTETLVELVIETYKNKKNVTILDLCTGSGAIAVSLAYYLPASRVTAVDISSVCLEIAQKNAEQNGVAERVAFHQGDVLGPLSHIGTYDCVVSNPPYIPTSALASLSPDVQAYEPHSALDGGEDGLLFYKHLAISCAHLLKPDGRLVMEIGHDQKDAVTQLMENSGFFEEIGICYDLAGIGRVVYGTRKNNKI